MQIDPVEHRPGHARLVIGGAARRARTGERRIAEMAAAARIHSRDQLNARGKADMRIGARDIDLAGFERLPERIEHGPLEFRYGGVIAPKYPTEE